MALTDDPARQAHPECVRKRVDRWLKLACCQHRARRWLTLNALWMEAEPHGWKPRAVGCYQLAYVSSSHMLQRRFDASPRLNLFCLALLLIAASLLSGLNDRPTAMSFKKLSSIVVDFKFSHSHVRSPVFNAAFCQDVDCSRPSSTETATQSSSGQCDNSTRRPAAMAWVSGVRVAAAWAS